jgi:hypothetical protein
MLDLDNAFKASPPPEITGPITSDTMAAQITTAPRRPPASEERR